nr:unnamed protein product [Callosobruchus chinensis]
MNKTTDINQLSVNYPHNASAYLQTNGLRHEEELINCGLKKLAIRLKGTFDISLCNSPKKSRENDSNACKNSSVVHLYHFEAKTVKSTSKKDEKRRQHQRGKSKDINEKQQESGDLNVQKNFEVYHAANYVDPKLSESYCPNKIIEWKGSWTLPVFLPKSKSKLKHTSSDNFDRTTHLHDGDSNFLQTSKNKTMDQEPCTSMVSTLCTMALGKQFVVLLFIVGSLCGFSLVSLCIRQLFGNQLLDILLKPRPKEYRITKYFNYVGNQIVHIITTIFDKLGKVLVLPSHKFDISLCNSPKKSRENDSNACKNSSVVHLYHFEAKTVKSVNKNINKFETKGSKTSKKDEKRRQHQRGKSKDINEKQQESGDLTYKKILKYITQQTTIGIAPNKIIEWKGSWTLPVFFPKSKSKLKHTSSDNFDRTTHLHDGDSNFLQTSKNKTMDQEPCTSMVSTLCTMALGKQFAGTVVIVGSLCGFSLVSLCIRQLFGNQLLDILFEAPA